MPTHKEEYIYYKKKYLKCKNEYNKLKKASMVFYFSHTTKDLKNLINILETGYILPGKDVLKDKRKLSGGIPQKHIYAHVHFKENKLTPFTIIIDPSIIDDHTIIFNKGWQADVNKDSITIDKNMKYPDKLQSIWKLQKIINNNKSLVEIMNHEILFDKKININKYVTKIVCLKEDKNKISKIINKHGYNIELTLY